MLPWLQAHAGTILFVWGVLWAAASQMQTAFPATSRVGRVIHVFLAISPLDIGKMLKQFGPPAAVLCLVFAALGCTPAKAPTSGVQVAATAVAALETAWTDAATACVDLADAQGDAGASTRAKCAAVLDPARTQLEAADAAVNAWGQLTDAGPPADVGALAAQLSIVVMAIEDVVSVEGVQVPASAAAASKAVLALLNSLAPSDGGVQ